MSKETGDNLAEDDKVQTSLDELAVLKESLEARHEPIILCQKKKNNPNFFAIIFANKKFYETFAVNEFNLIGKSYDFLFSELDLDYSSEDHQEYVRLIKAVKDFHYCSAVIAIPDHKLKFGQVKSKVTFNPTETDADDSSQNAIFVFEKADKKEITKLDNKTDSKSSVILLKNLERTLHNERLLREVGYLIISDLPIQKIAQKIAKILGEYLKADRCLIHDYSDQKANFVVEYKNDYTTKMLEDDRSDSGLRFITEYINFQNHFFERHGSKERKSGLFVVEDIESDQNFDQIREVFEKFSIISQIAITTVFNDKINGGIYIHQSDKKTWLADEIELVEMVANQFSIAIDRSQSVERVMVANQSLIELTSQLKESLEKEKEMRQMQNEFIALVSHEFKTPLQIIDSTREIISRKIKNHNIIDESLDNALNKIKIGIQRMNGLIHSSLNLARMESGDGRIKLEKQVFDLKNFVSEIIEKNSNLAISKKIKIVSRVDQLPTAFEGDPKLLDHSIANLISNAIKYSKNEGTVKIFAKVDDKKIALRIIDQGIGIPKEDLANIGQKFFRAKNTLAIAGTGIGIYLTKYFIELHGGEVAIESEVNIGTSATIILPKN